MGNVLLPDHLGEFLGTVLARENLVAHGSVTRLYVIAVTSLIGAFGLFDDDFMSLRDAASRGRLCGRGRPGSAPKEASMQLRLSTRTVDGVTVVDCDGRLVFGEESANVRDTVK